MKAEPIQLPLKYITRSFINDIKTAM